MVSTPPWRLTVATVFHTLAGYSIFFDVTVLNPMEFLVKQLANQSIISHYRVQVAQESLEWVWATVSTGQMVGALVGCWLIKYPAEKFGRRNTVMIIKNLIIIASGLIQFLSQPLNSIELLIIGRIIGGIAFTQTFIIPILLAESSPIEFRGLVSAAPSGIGCRVWAVAGALVPLLYNFSTTTWHYLLLCSSLPALIHFLATPLFPDSVKHLYIVKEDRKLSRKSSNFYHGPNVNADKLNKEMDKEAEISPTIKIANIKILLAAEQFRTPTIICVIAWLMVPIGGSSIVNYYSTGLLESVGISHNQAPLYNVLFVQLPTLPVTVVCVLLLEKAGRRLFMLGGVALCFFGMTILGLATLSLQINDSLPSVLSMVGFILLVVGLSVGPFLIPPVLSGELVPQAGRSLALGIAQFFRNIVEVVVGLAFPPLLSVIGSYCLLPLAFISLLSFIFLFRSLPESKGKTVRQIVQPWMSKRKRGVTTAGVELSIQDDNKYNSQTTSF